MDEERERAACSETELRRELEAIIDDGPWTCLLTHETMDMNAMVVLADGVTYSEAAVGAWFST